MELEWCCNRWDELLHIERGARLYMRYMQAQHVRYRPEDFDAWIAGCRVQGPTHQEVVR